MEPGGTGGCGGAAGARGELGRDIGWERRRTEITSLLAAVAGVLMLTGGAFSLVWFRRIP